MVSDHLESLSLIIIMWGKSYGWGWQLNPTWAERRLWGAAFAHATFCVLGTFGRILVALFGSAGLGSPKSIEDDQTMEIWPAGLRSAFGPIALVILALRAFFNGLYSDFGPRNLSL